MMELTVAAIAENIRHITDFVNRHLEALDCPMKVEMQIDIAIDEIISNIVQYAYTPETGDVTVRMEVIDDPMSIITFIDQGVPYNPLTAADPNTKLPVEERSPGGLGIFMVKKSMDKISYRYENGSNILSICKNFRS